MYSEFVDAWTSVWPRDQILFLRNEDYQAAPKEHLQAVMKFLGERCFPVCVLVIVCCRYGCTCILQERQQGLCEQNQPTTAHPTSREQEGTWFSCTGTADQPTNQFTI